MSGDFPSLVSSDWLAERLGTADIAIFDASLHLPASARDPRAEFAKAAIPGAGFLDLAALHKAAKQAIAVGDPLPGLTGLAPDQRIVIYDDSALQSSARAWHLLQALGFESVAILDGGLGRWRAKGRALHAGRAIDSPVLTHGNVISAALLNKTDMLETLQAPKAQILDARAADRVYGAGIDPVHGGANGRIPGSFNLPFGMVFNDDGTYKSQAALKAAFEDANLDLSLPIIASCGSGITASVLLFALHLIGKEAALYDGSWAEWSADPDMPKVQGP